MASEIYTAATLSDLMTKHESFSLRSRIKFWYFRPTFRIANVPLHKWHIHDFGSAFDLNIVLDA